MRVFALPPTGASISPLSFAETALRPSSRPREVEGLSTAETAECLGIPALFHAAAVVEASLVQRVLRDACLPSSGGTSGLRRREQEYPGCSIGCRVRHVPLGGGDETSQARL